MAGLLFLAGFAVLPGRLSPPVMTAQGATSIVAETGFQTTQKRPLAIVQRFTPLVLVRHSHGDQWQDAYRTHPLHDADTLRTGDDGFAVVQFMDNSVARVRPNSLLIINGDVRAPGSITSRISMEVGDMLLQVRGANSTYEVATPSAVAAVRGTRFSTQVTPDGRTFFTGFSGEIQIQAVTSGQLLNLTQGLQAEVDASGNTITLLELDDDSLNNRYILYDHDEQPLEKKTIRIRFVNDDGEEEIIEFEYYEVPQD